MPAGVTSVYQQLIVLSLSSPAISVTISHGCISSNYQLIWRLIQLLSGNILPPLHTPGAACKLQNVAQLSCHCTQKMSQDIAVHVRAEPSEASSE